MKRVTKITLNTLLICIITIRYLSAFNILSTPPFDTFGGASLEAFLSKRTPIQSFILSVFLLALVAALSFKCFGRTALGRTFVGGVVMHFSMEAYANVATLPYFSKYGICEGKCVDKVLWGASVGAIVMGRLEEKGWGGKVTWRCCGNREGNGCWRRLMLLGTSRRRHRIRKRSASREEKIEEAKN